MGSCRGMLRATLTCPGVQGGEPLTLRLSVNPGSFLSSNPGGGGYFPPSTYALAFWDPLGQPPALPAPPAPPSLPSGAPGRP